MTKPKGNTKTTVTRYEVGMNEIIDKYLEDGDVLWIIQSSRGRKPILADTEEEALERYWA